jgi:transposase
MSNLRYTPEFKDEAARQIVERRYSVADVSKRLGEPLKNIYVPHTTEVLDSFRTRSIDVT